METANTSPSHVTFGFCGIPGISHLLKTLLKWTLLICTFQKTVFGDHHGPSYTHSRHCSLDNQCITSIGEICWWFYDGCIHGQCMCDPRSHFMDASGKCRRVKYGSHSCYPGDRCPDRMQCRGGMCVCAERGMRMTDDRRFCLRPQERMLGQSCNHKTDSCYQAKVTEYTTKRVSCTNGQCKCSLGYKQVGDSCRKLHISEGSCSRDHHCQGGALCVERRCICPSGYLPVAGNSKCAKQGAQYDLGLGSICDEVHERRYCSEGLVCHKCPNDNRYTCVKYRESQSFNGALPRGVDQTVTIICVVSGVLAAILFILISSS